MKLEISHDWKEESREAKLRWFLQKTMEERLLEAFEETEFIQQLMQVEPPDDYSSFKTVKILRRK